MSKLTIKNINIRTRNYFDSNEIIILEFFINENNFLTYPIKVNEN